MTEKPRAMRDALLERIWGVMGHEAGVFFISADFGSPVLDRIRGDFPDRFVNVGIAEQNLINVSAGLALEGYTVFAYAIAPFITMRCCEQIRVNLAMLSKARRMNVNLIGVGAGYSYVVSGPTHQCYEDISIMRAFPNMTILSPSDHISAAGLLERCLSKDSPKYLRLDAQVLPTIYDPVCPDASSGFHVHGEETDICIVATGYMVHTALKVAATLKEGGVSLSVVDLFDLTGFDRSRLLSALNPCSGIVTMEEGFRGCGGLDAMLFDFLNANGYRNPILNCGVEGGYRFDLGTRAELHEQVGIGPEVMTRKIRDFAQRLDTGGIALRHGRIPNSERIQSPIAVARNDEKA